MEKEALNSEQADIVGGKLPNKNLSYVATVVSMGAAFNFGYQLLITNPAQAAFMQFVNESYLKQDVVLTQAEVKTTWGIIISLFFWGATLGAFLIQLVANGLGRTRGMILSFIVQVIAMLMSVASYFMTSHVIYAVSRFILGAAISVSLGIAPLFIAECSPVGCRGIISLATGVLLHVALVVGAVAAIPQLLGTVDLWWWLYAGEAIMTSIVIVLCLFIKGSPGFLLSRNKHKEAKESVKYYYGISDSLADLVVQKLEATNGTEKPFGLLSVFQDAPSRRGTIVGSFVMGAMTMSGIAAIHAFAVDIFQSVGLDLFQASIGNIIICFMTVLGALFSSGLIEKSGRRPLLIINYGLLALMNCLICGFMLLFQHYPQFNFIGWGLVISICFFKFVFCLGPGPIAFFISSELVSQRARGATSTWVNIVLNGTRSLLLAIYFPLENYLGGTMTYFILFFPPCILGAIILYFYLPETKGKTPEEAQASIKTLPVLFKRRKHYEEVQLKESGV